MLLCIAVCRLYVLVKLFKHLSSAVIFLLAPAYKKTPTVECFGFLRTVFTIK